MHFIFKTCRFFRLISWCYTIVLKLKNNLLIGPVKTHVHQVFIVPFLHFKVPLMYKMLISHTCSMDSLLMLTQSLMSIYHIWSDVSCEAQSSHIHVINRQFIVHQITFSIAIAIALTDPAMQGCPWKFKGPRVRKIVF